MSALVFVLVAGCAGAGCGKGEAPSCEEVVDHKISIFSGEIKRLAQSSRDVLIGKCASMSDRERRCVVDADTDLDLGKCEQDKKRTDTARKDARKPTQKSKKGAAGKGSNQKRSKKSKR